MAKSLEFVASRSGDSLVLWRHGDPSREDMRQKVVGNYFVVYNVTQEDSGRYTMRDRNGVRVSERNLDVEGDLTNNLCSVIPSAAVLFCVFADIKSDGLVHSLAWGQN